jgi:predicted component of type VI protein secretion system
LARFLLSRSGVKLEIYRQGRHVESLEFGHSVLRIGMFPTCDVRLEGRGIEGLHALIEPDPNGDGFTISQIGTSETRVNGGAPISRVKLRQGHRVQIGSYDIIVESESDSSLADVRVARRLRHVGVASHFDR